MFDFVVFFIPISIPLRSVFEAGNVPQQAYNVVKDKKFQGEVRVGLTFKPEVIIYGSSFVTSIPKLEFYQRL